jgi:hypothetical protein
MDSPDQMLTAALKAIQDMASNALNQIEPSQEQPSIRWKCKACRYIKRFHQARDARSRWQVLAMQKHGVYAYFVRNGRWWIYANLFALVMHGRYAISHLKWCMRGAEGVGFEPTVGFPTLDFESSALNRTQPPFRDARKER